MTRYITMSLVIAVEATVAELVDDDCVGADFEAEVSNVDDAPVDDSAIGDSDAEASLVDIVVALAANEDDVTPGTDMSLDLAGVDTIVDVVVVTSFGIDVVVVVVVCVFYYIVCMRACIRNNWLTTVVAFIVAL
jgi:hypothetical protein